MYTVHNNLFLSGVFAISQKNAAMIPTHFCLFVCCPSVWVRPMSLPGNRIHLEELKQLCQGVFKRVIIQSSRNL